MQVAGEGPPLHHRAPGCGPSPHSLVLGLDQLGRDTQHGVREIASERVLARARGARGARFPFDHRLTPDRHDRPHANTRRRGQSPWVTPARDRRGQPERCVDEPVHAPRLREHSRKRGTSEVLRRPRGRPVAGSDSGSKRKE